MFIISSKKKEAYEEFEHPKAPKPGYQTYPTMEELSLMNFSQLSQLPSFKIWNEFGEISFQAAEGYPGIDLTDVDLYKEI